MSSTTSRSVSKWRSSRCGAGDVPRGSRAQARQEAGCWKDAREEKSCRKKDAGQGGGEKGCGEQGSRAQVGGEVGRREEKSSGEEDCREESACEESCRGEKGRRREEGGQEKIAFSRLVDAPVRSAHSVRNGCG